MDDLLKDAYKERHLMNIKLNKIQKRLKNNRHIRSIRRTKKPSIMFLDIIQKNLYDDIPLLINLILDILIHKKSNNIIFNSVRSVFLKRSLSVYHLNDFRQRLIASISDNTPIKQSNNIFLIIFISRLISDISYCRNVYEPNLLVSNFLNKALIETKAFIEILMKTIYTDFTSYVQIPFITQEFIHMVTIEIIEKLIPDNPC